MRKTKDKKWEERFDKEFAIGQGRHWIMTSEELADVKQFISNLLSEQKKELREKIEKMKVEKPLWGDDIYNQAIDDILKLL